MDLDNKSLSQLAVLWMLVILKSPGGLGTFATRTLENAASSQVDCLVFGMITTLNFLWGGLRRGSRLHSGPWRAHHRTALNHLTESASYVIRML